MSFRFLVRRASSSTAVWSRSPGEVLAHAAATWRSEEVDLPDKSKLRARMWADETEVNRANLFTLKTSGGVALAGQAAEARIVADATALVNACRAPGARGATSPVQALLHEYSLSSREGVTLLGLAEALLRVRSAEGRSRLIADKLAGVGGLSAVRQKAASSWAAGHIGASKPLIVNAAATALATGEAVVGARFNLAHQLGASFGGPLGELVSRLGEPAVRVVVTALMRRLGDEFVLGETIEAAIRRGAAEARAHAASGALGGGPLAQPRQLGFSFDMLGEAAKTRADAEDYREAYAHAIAQVGAAAKGALSASATGNAGVAPERLMRPGLSLKLSALDARFEPARRSELLRSLVHTVGGLAEAAAERGVDLTLDAEEASRLELQLDVLQAVSARLARSHPGWDGLGLALQTYQRRATAAIDWLAEVSRRDGRRLRVRLVKGAYWDSEVKLAQTLGLPTFPVYTRKEATDLCYAACAAKVLLEHPAAFSPAFATHNARTLAVVAALARARGWAAGSSSGSGSGTELELQRLHGMGQDLHHAATAEGGCLTGVGVRVYAPVGDHGQLLAYLVRRLLENGANSSFVHALADPSVDAAWLAADPAALLEHGLALSPHPRIAPPLRLFCHEPSPPAPGPAAPGPAAPGAAAPPGRLAARGAELSADLCRLEAFAALMRQVDGPPAQPRAGPGQGPLSGWRLALPTSAAPGASEAAAPLESVRDPATGGVAGLVRPASAQDVGAALAAAREAQPAWDALGAPARASVLRAAAALLEAHCAPLCALLVLEAGKTLPDCVAEVREAVDFLGYYAAQAELTLQPVRMRGPVGERNELSFRGRGVWASVAPWNFPLAIFVGQAAAALVAGNAVVAKSAPQTPLSGAAAVALLHLAGVPPAVLAHLPGGADVGRALVADPRVDGVVFTGSGAAARSIARALAARPDECPLAPLIAETAGLNALIADESALPEQLVADAMRSAFGSAGQRCSSARLLCVPSASAETVLRMLAGAMAELRVADPALLDTDVGPLIDAAAKARVQAHVDGLLRLPGVRLIARAPAARLPAGAGAEHLFVEPVALELPSLASLPLAECFGPVLHVLRYDSTDARSLETLIRQVNALGFGLTMGLHSRLDSAHATAISATAAGNLYINRDTIGAVVESQPFGGSRLSGTGPKAGGPNYVGRFAVEHVVCTNTAASGGDHELLALA